MFSEKLTKNFLYAAAALCLLSSCTASDGSSPSSTLWQFNDRAEEEANMATVAYSQGKFNEAENHVSQALQLNPKQQQALMVGAMVSEELGRPNRARQYYEDLIVLNGNETSILGSTSGKPEKMSEIAKQRLRMINIKQSKLVIEDDKGNNVFDISKTAGLRQSKSAIAQALFMREKQKAKGDQPSTEEEIKSAEVLFSDNEQNMISRFLILKELAEKDLVTKEEFLNARMTNVGALLPLTNTAPAYGIDKSVPSPDLIVERISVLKDAVESRAITPREFSVERNLIIETLLPPNPRQRMRNKAPAKDIMSAAKDLRKLEVLYDLNLITAKEKAKEQQAIEKYLGINRAAQKTVTEPVKPSGKTETAPVITPATPVEIIETKVEVSEKPQMPKPNPVETSPATPLLPMVSSPF